MLCKFYVHDINTHNSCVNWIESDPGGVGICKLPGNFLCTKDLEHVLPGISHSSRNTFVHCRQAWYFYYIKGIREKKVKSSESIKLGSIWDYFQMSRYNNGVIPKVQRMGGDEKFAGEKFKDVVWNLCAEYELPEYSSEKLYAICKAFIKLGINLDKNIDEVQKEFHIVTPEAIVKGYVDVAYCDHFKEVKFGKSPQFYHTLMNIENQIATYFLSNPDYQYCIIEATKAPQQKPGRETKKNPNGETPEAYGKRVYDHIISKPSEYFPGWNKNTKTFGKRYYREEFPLKEIEDDYKKINRDIFQACRDGAFYQSKICFAYGQNNPCRYLPICSNRVVSEELYDFVEDDETLEFRNKNIKED